MCGEEGLLNGSWNRAEAPQRKFLVPAELKA
jgi:hypothetical protein